MNPTLYRFAGWFTRRALRDRRGSVAIIAAVSMGALLAAAGIAIDMSRLTDARASLQRAADNAALSGAAAYVAYTPNDDLNPVARKMAKSAFCNAVTALPAGFTLSSPTGSTSCSGQASGPVVSAVVDGFNAGTRGTVANSGCSGTKPAGTRTDITYTCGFIVTVAATATVNTILSSLPGGVGTVSVTASAVNPFIRLNKAISATLIAYAYNANSLWIYPLLLDSNGVPDFITDAGARPSTSQCTGNPTQTVCGAYTMLASNYYQQSSVCNPNSYCCPQSGSSNCSPSSSETVFYNGVVQNPDINNAAVITATTPLGIAFQSSAGVVTSFGDQCNPNKTKNPKKYYNLHDCAPLTPEDIECYWPASLAYNTVSQVFDANGYPLVLDSNGLWSVTTHWFYSSYLANNQPPDAAEIANQTKGAAQIVPAVPWTSNAFKPKAITPALSPCLNPTSASNPANAEPGMTTTYPTSGATNCALYIMKDLPQPVPPATLQPDPSYKNNGVCWSPTNTPGYQYAALSCQNYAGHKFAFFWNDMSGGSGSANSGDDTDYGNGTLQVSCAGASYVMLIN